MLACWSFRMFVCVCAATQAFPHLWTQPLAGKNSYDTTPFNDCVFTGTGLMLYTAMQ